MDASASAANTISRAAAPLTRRFVLDFTNTTGFTARYLAPGEEEPAASTVSVGGIFGDIAHFLKSALQLKDLLLLVLSAIEAFLVALSEVAGDAMAAFHQCITGTINIPVISNLYKSYAGADLSWMDLVCLMLAAPTTILYKIFYGGSQAAPPFTQNLVNTITSTTLPWPTVPTSTAALLADANGDGPNIQVLLARFLAFAYVIGFIVYAVIDISLDMIAAGASIDDASVQLGIASIVTTCALQALGAPWATFFKSSAERSKADD